MRPEYKRSKVGFPIRKSLDQSSFAAPQGLSQRTTSFIASQRQGIHRMLLRHLITLMIDARPRQRRTRPKRKTSPADFSTRLLLAKYTRPNSLRGRRVELLVQPAECIPSLRFQTSANHSLSRTDANLCDTGQKQHNHPNFLKRSKPPLKEVGGA
jgi:hypothetical protein